MAADAAAAHRLIRDAMPASIAAIAGTQELEGMRQRLLALPGPVQRVLDRHDLGAAVRIFLLVVIATFPVVIPFLLTRDLAAALLASRVVTLAMLFLFGFVLGRYASYVHPVRSGVFAMAVGAALIAAVIVLGG